MDETDIEVLDPFKVRRLFYKTGNVVSFSDEFLAQMASYEAGSPCYQGLHRTTPVSATQICGIKPNRIPARCSLTAHGFEP